MSAILTAPSLPATEERRGVLKIDNDASTTAASVESLDAVSTVADAGLALATTADATATSAESLATSASVTAGSAAATASVAADDAAAAIAAADAAVAAASSFPVDDFLGTIDNLADDPGDPTTLTGKWWQIGVAGTLTDSNAGGLTVAIGDRILCDGTDWNRWLLPPFYVPDGSLTREKIELGAQRQWGREQVVEGHVWGVLDALNRMGLALRADGTVVGKLGVSLGVGNGLSWDYNEDGTNTLSLGTTSGILPVGSGTLDASSNRDDLAFAIVDSNNLQALKVAADGTVTVQKLEVSELTAARGTRDLLTERLDSGLTAHGLPKRYTWGLEYLRETRQRLRKLAIGDSSTLTIALIGDSWTHNYLRYSGPVASTLKATYGNAGLGWVGFSWPSGLPALINGSIDPASSLVTVAGSWSPTYYTSTSPDLGHLSSSTAGDLVTVTGPASCSAVVLYHRGGGVVRYRWDGGAWTSATLSGSTLQTVSLASVPAGTWALEIEVVSGTPVLCGLDIQKSTSGVRVHKLGSTGSNSLQWAAVNASEWQSGLTALAPSLVVIMHGTNDQSAYEPATFRTHMETILDRVRVAVPAADILLMAPCENIRVGNAWPMEDYAEQAYQLAEEYSAGFLNLQPVFGLVPADYANGSARSWFNADLVHPDPTTGGRAIVDAVIRTLTTA